MHVLIVINRGCVEEVKLIRGVIEAEEVYKAAIKEAGFKDEDEMRDSEGMSIILWQNAEEL